MDPVDTLLLCDALPRAVEMLVTQRDTPARLATGVGMDGAHGARGQLGCSFCQIGQTRAQSRGARRSHSG